MRKLRDLRKAKGGASPFDGVRAAENGMQKLRIVRCLFQTQKVSLQVGKQVPGLVKKSLMEHRHIYVHAGNTFSMTLTSCSGWKGLTIHPVAPAALPSALRLSPLSVVSIKMGVKRQPGRVRH